MSAKNLVRFSWITLAYTVGVILWGAFVRATGSGAGCGSHWPLCNGQVVPRAVNLEMLIEYGHRITSGLGFLLVLVLCVLVYRSFSEGHRARLAAGFAVLFMVSEALVGAALVLFEWVAYDTSGERAIVMGFHLINTFFLLASLTLTAWWVNGEPAARLSLKPLNSFALGLAFLGLCLVGASGGVAALGDTLFQVSTLSEGLKQDFSPTAHAFIRLRVWHPVFAVIIALYMITISIVIGDSSRESKVRGFGRTLITLTVIQLACGILNLALLAPVWLQLVHLLLADLIVIYLTLFSVTALQAPAKPEALNEEDRRITSVSRAI